MYVLWCAAVVQEYIPTLTYMGDDGSCREMECWLRSLPGQLSHLSNTACWEDEARRPRLSPAPHRVPGVPTVLSNATTDSTTSLAIFFYPDMAFRTREDHSLSFLAYSLPARVKYGTAI